MKILDQVKKFTIPTPKEQDTMKRLAEYSLKLVKDQAAKFPDVVSVELGGSYAKGTWLQGELDLDIFIKLKKETGEKTFETVGKKIGFDALKKFKPYV